MKITDFDVGQEVLIPVARGSYGHSQPGLMKGIVLKASAKRVLVRFSTHLGSEPIERYLAPSNLRKDHMNERQYLELKLALLVVAGQVNEAIYAMDREPSKLCQRLERIQQQINRILNMSLRESSLPPGTNRAIPESMGETVSPATSGDDSRNDVDFEQEEIRR